MSKFKRGTYGAVVIIMPDSYGYIESVHGILRDQFGRTLAELVTQEGASKVESFEISDRDCDGAMCDAVSPPPDFRQHKHVGWKAVIS